MVKIKSVSTPSSYCRSPSARSRNIVVMSRFPSLSLLLLFASAVLAAPRAWIVENTLRDPDFVGGVSVPHRQCCSFFPWLYSLIAHQTEGRSLRALENIVSMFSNISRGFPHTSTLQVCSSIHQRPMDAMSVRRRTSSAIPISMPTMYVD